MAPGLPTVSIFANECIDLTELFPAKERSTDPRHQYMDTVFLGAHGDCRALLPQANKGEVKNSGGDQSFHQEAAESGRVDWSRVVNAKYERGWVEVDHVDTKTLEFTYTIRSI